MKLNDAHISALRKALKPFLNVETEEVYREAGMSDKRYRWDAFWSACRHTPSLNDVVREIYQYANDDHIDTVLRMLAREAKTLIGSVVFRCGVETIDETPVYYGEAPDSDKIYERAQRACRIVNPTKVHLLAQCERRFYPVERGAQNGQ